MVQNLARPELSEPIQRIARRVDEAIESLRAYSRTPLWDRAVSATLTTSKAPKHLLRAQLVLLGSMAGGGAPEGAVVERFAVGVELLHLFMLVHDDVMDNATLRRGVPALRIALQSAEPSLDIVLARDLAIVMGNLLNILAMRHLTPGEGARAGEGAAVDLVLESCFRAGAAQFQDLLGLRGLGDDETMFRSELAGKSAYQTFAAPFGAGIRLALPRGEAEVQKGMDWGCLMGFAYQAVDDLSDILSPPSVTGKDNLRDLVEGRASLPLFLLQKRTEGEDRELLDSLVGKKRQLMFGERKYLNELLERYGILEAAATEATEAVRGAVKLRGESGFPAAAQQGMMAIEEGLLGHLAKVRKAGA